MSSTITVSGKHVIEQLLIHHPNNIKELLILNSIQYKPHIQTLINQAEKQSVTVKILPKQTLHQIGKSEIDPSLLAITAPPKRTLLKTILENPRNYPFIVILDHIEDPFNVGAIIRTCESFGISALIFPKDRQAPINAGVIKASSGAAFHLPLVEVSNITASIKQLKKSHYWIYGADSQSKQPINHLNVLKPLAVVMGNENKGLSLQVKKNIDEEFAITTTGKTPSLNVSVATGIIIHTLTRKIS